MIFVFGLIAVAMATMMDVDPPFEENIPNIPFEENTKNHKPFHVTLDADSLINFKWWVEHEAKLVHFEVEFDEKLPSFKWFALGFSDRGLMTNADLCILNIGYTASLMDGYTDASGKITIKNRKHCLDFSWNEEYKTLMYSRHFDTCESYSYVIEDGTTHLVWGISNAKKLNSIDDFEKTLMTRVQMIKNGTTNKTSKNDPTRIFDVVVDKYEVPNIDTMYYCTVHKLPDWLIRKQHHLIKYESIIPESSRGVVHHMEVFYCNAPKDQIIESYSGSCLNDKRPDGVKLCQRVKAAWAMGAGPFEYPQEAGVPLGGPETNHYLVLEIHYNNPELKQGLIDSSGVRLYVTPLLRKYEASIMELGLIYTDKMMIPPGQKHFALAGYCVSSCTKTGFPKNGIVVFGSQLHTHLTGIKVRTRHFRNGVELKPLNLDNHYSTHFQEIRLLKKQVYLLPGDSLITECIYNTENKHEVTFGGHSIQDEMCVNYIHYYPASKLEVCKSAVSQNSLDEYFKNKRFMNRYLKSSEGTSIRSKYNEIDEWNTYQVAKLKSLFYNKTIDMDCLSPSGKSLSGNWMDLTRDPIFERLEEKQRECRSNMDFSEINCSINSLNKI